MDELRHHGVKGMKWGVRRTDAKLGRSSGGKAGQQKASEAKKRTDVKNRGALTSEQLSQKIKRLRMEKELRELTDGEVNSGRRTAEGILKNIGTQTVTKVASTALAGAALYGIQAAVTKQFNAKEFGAAIFNGGAKKK